MRAHNLAQGFYLSRPGYFPGSDFFLTRCHSCEGQLEEVGGRRGVYVLRVTAFGNTGSTKRQCKAWVK
jgi:hypothetical protein